MNDWWNYLAHSQEGQERKGHKYYARVAVGRNKLGFTQYRYFYDAREYGAYMTRKNRAAQFTKTNGKKASDFGTARYRNSKQDGGKTTYYVTGRGPLLKSDIANADIKRTKTTGEDTLRIRSDKDGFFTGSSATAHKKTVKDHPNLRKAKQSIKTAVKKGKDFVSGLVTNNTKITMLSDMDGKSTKKYVSGKKKGKSFISSLFSDNPKITMLRDMDGKSVKKYIAGKK